MLYTVCWYKLFPTCLCWYESIIHVVTMYKRTMSVAILFRFMAIFSAASNFSYRKTASAMVSTLNKENEKQSLSKTGTNNKLIFYFQLLQYFPLVTKLYSLYHCGMVLFKITLLVGILQKNVHIFCPMSNCRPEEARSENQTDQTSILFSFTDTTFSFIF